MVRVIQQETFDAVVEENMTEFSMERPEAVRDAREQFEQQGVSLANIVVSELGSQVVVEAVKALFGPAGEGRLAALTTIQECCATDLAQRVLATDSGAYSALLRLAREEEEPAVRCQVLVTLVKVMDTNPDHLEVQGVELIHQLLAEGQDMAVTAAALDWVLTCCVRHEANRQAIVDRPGLLGRLAELAGTGDRVLLVGVCRLWVQLVQDDDVRVPFGKAHEHAREMVESHKAVTVLTRALLLYLEDTEAAGHCLLGLASLVLRDEYCQEVVEEGGLRAVLDLLADGRAPELVTRALVLLKVLAGNDQVKTEVGRAGGVPLIVTVMTKYLKRASTAEAGCAALAAVCLRQSDNAKQVVVECEGATLITAVMEFHAKHRRTQGAAAAAIRNIVSRDKELIAAFVDREAEQLLNQALEEHGEHIGDTLRSALRDLDLKVELQERWVGDKVLITESFVETEGVH